MMTLSRHKQMLSRPVAFDPFKLSELMENVMVPWDTSGNCFPSSVRLKAEGMELFESNEGGSSASGLL